MSILYRMGASYLTITRPSKTVVVNAKATNPGQPTLFQALCSIQPLSYMDHKLLEKLGERRQGLMKIYSDVRLQTVDEANMQLGDVVPYDGRQWAVNNFGTFDLPRQTRLPHFKSYIELIMMDNS